MVRSAAARCCVSCNVVRGVGQVPLDRVQGSGRCRQRATQLRLARRQPLGRLGEFRLPLASLLFERGCRVGDLLCERVGSRYRRVVLHLKIGEARRPCHSIGLVLAIRGFVSIPGGSQLRGKHRARVSLTVELLFERDAALGRRGPVRGGTLLRVLQCRPGVGQVPLDRVQGSGRCRQRVTQLRLARRQPLGPRRVGCVTLLGAAEGRFELQQSILEARADPVGAHRCRAVLRVRIVQARGQRGQLRGVAAFCVLTRELRGGEPRFERRARRLLLAEMCLEGRLSPGGRGQVGGGALLGLPMRMLRIGKTLFRSGAQGGVLRRDGAQLGLSPGELAKRGCLRRVTLVGAVQRRFELEKPFLEGRGDPARAGQRGVVLGLTIGQTLLHLLTPILDFPQLRLEEATARALAFDDGVDVRA